MMNTKSTTKFSTKVVCAGGILRGRIVQSAKAILRFSKNKTIGDEGITVDFRFIKVHTSN